MKQLQKKEKYKERGRFTDIYILLSFFLRLDFFRLLLQTQKEGNGMRNTRMRVEWDSVERKEKSGKEIELGTWICSERKRRRRFRSQTERIEGNQIPDNSS